MCYTLVESGGLAFVQSGKFVSLIYMCESMFVKLGELSPNSCFRWGCQQKRKPPLGRHTGKQVKFPSNEFITSAHFSARDRLYRIRRVSFGPHSYTNARMVLGFYCGPRAKDTLVL